jgi:hypothetical protein
MRRRNRVLLGGVVQFWRGPPSNSFLACLSDWYRRDFYSSRWVMARIVGWLYCFSLCWRLRVPKWLASTFEGYQHTTMTSPQAPLPCDWNEEDSTCYPYLNCLWLSLFLCLYYTFTASSFMWVVMWIAEVFQLGYSSILIGFPFGVLLVFLANMCFEPPSGWHYYRRLERRKIHDSSSCVEIIGSIH